MEEIIEDKLLESTLSSIHYEFIHNTDKFLTKTVEDDEVKECYTQYIYYVEDEDNPFAIAEREISTTNRWTLILRDRFNNEVEQVELAENSFCNNYIDSIFQIVSRADEKINKIADELEKRTNCNETEETKEENPDKDFGDFKVKSDEVEKIFKELESNIFKDPNTSEDESEKEICNKQIAKKIEDFLNNDDEVPFDEEIEDICSECDEEEDDD